VTSNRYHHKEQLTTSHSYGNKTSSVIAL